MVRDVIVRVLRACASRVSFAFSRVRYAQDIVDWCKDKAVGAYRVLMRTYKGKAKREEVVRDYDEAQDKIYEKNLRPDMERRKLDQLKAKFRSKYR